MSKLESFEASEICMYPEDIPVCGERYFSEKSVLELLRWIRSNFVDSPDATADRIDEVTGD